MLKSWQEYRELSRSFLSNYIERPIARLFNLLGFSPNKITILGLILNIVTSHQIIVGNFFQSGILLAIASSLDMVDGALARMQNKESWMYQFDLDQIEERSIETLKKNGAYNHVIKK